MSYSKPDYKLLYEQSQQKLARIEERLSVKEQQLSYTEQNLSRAQQQLSQAEQQLTFTEQKLQLALLEINELRAKLFGSKSDQRVKKAADREVDVLPLGATIAEVASSEALLKAELAQVEQGQQKTTEKRAKAATTRMVLPAHLEREEVIIDPAGDLSEYHIIGEEITEVLTPDRPGP